MRPVLVGGAFSDGIRLDGESPPRYNKQASKQHGSVAQSVEQRPFKPWVQGSSPCAPNDSPLHEIER